MVSSTLSQTDITQVFHECFISFKKICPSSNYYLLTYLSLLAMGLSIKDVWIFMAVFDTPPPPCRNFDPDLPNFYLLKFWNIGIWDPTNLPSLKYSDFFYGWPLWKIKLHWSVSWAWKFRPLFKMIIRLGSPLLSFDLLEEISVNSCGRSDWHQFRGTETNHMWQIFY